MSDQWRGPVVKVGEFDAVCVPITPGEGLTIDLAAGTYEIAAKDIDGARCLSVVRVKPALSS
jgi:hypothetical protein